MWIAIGILILLLLVWLGAGLVFYMLTLARHVGKAYRYERYHPKSDGNQKLYDWEKSLPVPPVPVSITSGKITLTGQEFLAAEPGNKWLIAIHGLGLSKEFMRYVAFSLHDKGINVLSIDLRAHGDSGGRSTSLGWRDRLEVALWAEELTRRHPGCKIILFGISLGAATAVMASGEALPPNVCAVVADSAFSDVPQLFHHICKNMFHLPPKLILPSYKILAGILGGVRVTDISPINQMMKSGNLPILFIHGLADTLIPSRMSEEMYKAAGDRGKLYLVPDAIHCYGFLKDPDYWTKVIAFMDEAYANNER